MKTASHSIVVIVILLAVVVAGPAVNSSAAAQEASQRPSDSKVDLVEVPQPDLAGVDPPVQEQIRAAQAALAATLARPDASSVEKARAFGSLGEIYQAYNFDDPALASYQNAAKLEPQSFRWEYYAGYLHQLNGDTDASLA